jgi:uncharacterized protein (TIGR02722 family)
MNKIKLAILSVAIVLSTGCSTVSVRNVDTHNDKEIAVKGLSSVDFKNVANYMIDSMLRSGRISKKDGGRYILVIGDITNDTMQRIDTDQFIRKIRVALAQTDKVSVTMAIGPDGAEDKMLMKQRQLRGHEEFNQKTVAGKGQMLAYDLSLTGKIYQSNVRVDRSKERIEYNFWLVLSDPLTGVAFWEDETVIVKEATGGSVSW